MKSLRTLLTKASESNGVTKYSMAETDVEDSFPLISFPDCTQMQDLKEF